VRPRCCPPTAYLPLAGQRWRALAPLADTQALATRGGSTGVFATPLAAHLLPSCHPRGDSVALAALRPLHQRRHQRIQRACSLRMFVQAPVTQRPAGRRAGRGRGRQAGRQGLRLGSPCKIASEARLPHAQLGAAGHCVAAPARCQPAHSA